MVRPAGSGRRDDRDLFAYLLTHVRVTDCGCRVWAGPLDSYGYPRITINRRPQSARRALMRLYLAAYGEVLADQFVYPRAACEHPKTCMALEHLLVGTRQQAMAAAARRGEFITGLARAMASARGCRHARMPMSRHREVAALLAEGREYAEIAAVFGVSRSAVSQAVYRWRKLGLLPG